MDSELTAFYLIPVQEIAECVNYQRAVPTNLGIDSISLMKWIKSYFVFMIMSQTVSCGNDKEG